MTEETTENGRDSGAPVRPSNGTAKTGPSLLLRGVCKAFGDVVAVDGLDLEVARGECFGLLGPNGAGKTTTIEICEGITVPEAGTVEVLGLTWRTGANELRQRIGIQLQETQFPDKLTVTEVLRMFRSFFQHGISVEESIQTAQLEEKRHARVVTLSGGQKQRLAMACALVGDPELLFLDEPTTAWIRRRGVTCGTSWTNSNSQGAPSFSPRTTWTRQSGCATAWPSWTTAKSLPWEHRSS